MVNENEIIEIDELISDETAEGREKGLREGNWNLLERRAKQKRLTLYHYVVHALAVFIVISYILLIVWKYSIPKEFSTIVSIVIGFYFAKSLFNNF